MIYYISDTHFGHANMITIDNRPFSNLKEMDDYIIKAWNSKVTNDDDVYFLGDFAYRTNSKAIEIYASLLRGKKHLIKGNHDGALLKNPAARKHFVSIDDLLVIDDRGRKVVLCHYPIVEWPFYYRGAYHVFGHVHNAHKYDREDNMVMYYMRKEERALNAGCMLNNYEPVTLEELIENNKRFKAF